MQVDASNQELVQIDERTIMQLPSVEPGSAASSVRYLNLSHNLLMEVSGLTSFLTLTHLDLSNNKISSLRGIPLTVVKLDASHNDIEHLSGLEALSQLQECNLSCNRISSIGGLSRNTKLRVLKLAHNTIGDLAGVEHLKALECLDLEDNLIATTDDLRSLSILTALKILRFLSNPVASLPSYKVTLLHLCPQLVRLDGDNTPGYLRHSMTSTPNQRNTSGSNLSTPASVSSVSATPFLTRGASQRPASASRAAKGARPTSATPSKSSTSFSHSSSVSSSVSYSSAQTKTPLKADRMTPSSTNDSLNSSHGKNHSRRPSYDQYAEHLDFHSVKVRAETLGQKSQTEKEDLEQQLRALEMRLDLSENRRKELEAELLRVQSRPDAAQAAVAEAVTKKMILRMQDNETRLHELSTDRSRMEADLRSTSVRLKSCERIKSELQQKLDSVLKENDQLRYENGRMQADLETARKELAKAKRSFEEVVADVAHEISRRDDRDRRIAVTADARKPSDIAGSADDELQLSASSWDTKKGHVETAGEGLEDALLDHGSSREDGRSASVSAGNASRSTSGPKKATLSTPYQDVRVTDGRNFADYVHCAGPSANGAQVRWQGSLRSSTPLMSSSAAASSGVPRSAPIVDERVGRKAAPQSTAAAEDSSTSPSRSAVRPSSGKRGSTKKQKSRGMQVGELDAGTRLPQMDESTLMLLESIQLQNQALARRIRNVLQDIDSSEQREMANSSSVSEIDSPNKWQLLEDHMKSRMTSPSFPRHGLPLGATQGMEDRILEAVVSGSAFPVSENAEKSIEFAIMLKRWLMLELDRASEDLSRKRALREMQQETQTTSGSIGPATGPEDARRHVSPSPIAHSQSSASRADFFVGPTAYDREEHQRQVRLQYQSIYEELRKQKSTI